MKEKNTQNQQKPEQKQIVQENKFDRKPNEYAGYYFSSSLKITDTESGKVILQMRCD